MRTASPSRKICRKQVNPLLTMLFFSVSCNWLSGCAVLSIPSYRVGQCSPGDSSPSGPSCDDLSAAYPEESCSASQCDPELCDEAHYVPVFPPIPTIPAPKFVQRWKEHRNLPEGPKGLRFHPLPTRPMFTPKPANPSIAVAGFQSVEGGGCTAYGTIPQGAQWAEPTGATGAAGASDPSTKPSPTNPLLNPPQPAKTELSPPATNQPALLPENGSPENSGETANIKADLLPAPAGKQSDK